MAEPLEVAVEQSAYVVGDEVRGRVQVLADLPTCTALVVRLEYSGKRLSVQKVVEVRVAAGPLHAGDSHAFAAVIPPEAPFSCEGKEHGVGWRARAQADVPWAIDPKADAAFEVLPLEIADEAQAEVLTVIEAVHKDPPSPGSAALIWLVIGVLVLALAPLLPLFLIIIAHQRVRDSRLTGFALDPLPRRFLLGEWVPLTVRFRLKRPVEVERFTITLQGTEMWSTGSADSRSTHYHHFHEETVEVLADTILALRSVGTLDGDRTFGGVYRARQQQPANASPDFVYQTALQLPLDGLPTAGGSIYYQLTARLQLRGWPDAKAEAKVLTLGARFTGPVMKPKTPPLDTSGRSRIVFLSKGEPAPEGVDLSTARGTTGRWILLSTVGLAATGIGLAMWIDVAHGSFLALAAAGLAMLVAGIWSFVQVVR